MSYDISAYNTPESLSQYREKFEAVLKQPNWHQLMQNKTIAHLFLDKVIPVEARDFIDRYGYGSSTCASLGFIHLLESVKTNPYIIPEIRELIDEWLTKEKKYIPVAILIDGMRLNHSSLTMLESGRSTDLRLNISEQDISSLSKFLISHISQLKKDEFYPVLGGYDIHETRLSIKRNSDGSFNVIHFNTAQKRVAKEWIGVRKATLESLEFWKAFYAIKFGSDDISEMDDFLKEKLGKHTALPSEMVKSVQKSESCPTQSLVAEFKAFLVGHFEPNKGLEQYKLIKSLLAEYAVKEDNPAIDPQMRKHLLQALQGKFNYVNWALVADVPEKYRKIVAVYEAALLEIDPTFRFESVYSPTPLLHLAKLDKKLQSSLHKFSLPEARDKMRSINDQLLKIFPHSTTRIFTRNKTIKRREAVVDRYNRHNSALRSDRLKGKTFLFAALQKALPSGLCSTVVNYLRPEEEDLSIVFKKEIKNLDTAKQLLQEATVAANAGALSYDEVYEFLEKAVRLHYSELKEDIHLLAKAIVATTPDELIRNKALLYLLTDTEKFVVFCKINPKSIKDAFSHFKFDEIPINVLEALEDTE